MSVVTKIKDVKLQHLFNCQTKRKCQNFYNGYLWGNIIFLLNLKSITEWP